MVDKQSNQHQIKLKNAQSFQYFKPIIALIVISELTGQCFRIWYLKLFKPFPIVMLILYTYLKSSPSHKVSNFIKIGLVFCLVGDIFLMFQQILYFNIGTAFFMIGHTFYILAFRIGKATRSLSSNFELLRKVANLLLLLTVFLNVYTLWDVIPNKLLYTLYALILGIQAMLTLSRYEFTSKQSFNQILYGVILFAISDNLLGFLKFNSIKTDIGRCVIMITYYGAQFFIASGALKQDDFLNTTSTPTSPNKNKST